MTPATIQQLVRAMAAATAAEKRPSFVWNHQSYSVVVTQFVAGAAPTKLFKGNFPKPVQAVRIYSARSNAGFVVIGGASITSLTHGIEQVHPGEGISFSMGTNDWFDEVIDAGQLYAVNSEPTGATLMVTLWTRTKRPL